MGDRLAAAKEGRTFIMDSRCCREGLVFSLAGVKVSLGGLERIGSVRGAAKNAYKVPSSCGPLREHDRANNNELPCVSCRTTLGSWLRGRFRGLCSHWFSHCIVCTCMPIICMKWPCVGDVQVDTETTAAPLARARTICLRGLCLSDKSPRKAGVESKMARCAFSWRPGPGGLSCIFGRTLLRD